MSAERVVILRCEECQRAWLHDGDRWRAYLSNDYQVVVYCPVCAEREFDDS